MQKLERRGDGVPASYYEHWRYIHQRLLNSSRVLVLLDLVGCDDWDKATDAEFFEHDSLMRCASRVSERIHACTCCSWRGENVYGFMLSAKLFERDAATGRVALAPHLEEAVIQLALPKDTINVRRAKSCHCHESIIGR